MAERTTGRWARRITSAGELPTEFQRPFQALELDRSTFPLVLFSPAYRSGRHEWTPKLLVVDEGRRLVCVELRPPQVLVAELDLGRVDCVEWGAILLDGWIRLGGDGPDGRTWIRVEYNAATSDLFMPLVRRLRASFYPGTAATEEQAAGRFAHLARSDFAFMNFARRSLIPGMEVRSFWLQRRVSSRFLALFTRVKIPGSMVILTQSELVLVHEGDGSAFLDYGATWTCVPLRAIRRIEVVPTGTEAVHVIVELTGGDLLPCELSCVGEPELRELVGKTMQLLADSVAG